VTDFSVDDLDFAGFDSDAAAVDSAGFESAGFDDGSLAVLPFVVDADAAESDSAPDDLPRA